VCVCVCVCVCVLYRDCHLGKFRRSSLVPTISDEETNYRLLGLSNMKNQNRYHVQGFVYLFPLFYTFLKCNLLDTMLNTLRIKRVRVDTHT
jgi:hypothetical protein